MKKLTLAIFPFILTGCSLIQETAQSTVEPVQSPTFDHNAFIGYWECQTKGGNIGTTNNITLNENGKVDYQGVILLPKDNPIFHYNLKRAGMWQYENQQLSYYFTKNHVEPAHSAGTLDAIKKDKALATAEKSYLKALQSQLSSADAKAVKLTITDFTPEKFALHTATRQGYCVKPQTK